MTTVWQRVFRSALAVAAALAAVVVVFRVLGLLGPRYLAPLLPLGFIVMAVVPFVFLTRAGRVSIGMVRPARVQSYAIAAVVGTFAATVCFVAGFALYGTTPDNWFVTIAGYYRQQMDTGGLSLPQLYLVFTAPALVLSPIGEELFFRGLLQTTLQQRFSYRASTSVEAGLFALVHLCHHGLAVTTAGLVLRPVSAAIWVLLMFLTAVAFAWLRRSTGSVLPAIAAHMGFNAAMNALIFGALWH